MLGKDRRVFGVTAVWCLLLLSQGIYCPLPTVNEYLVAHNKARTNPKYYATFIDTEYKSKTSSSTKLHSVWMLTFNEACPAVFDEAINYQNAATALGTLQLDLGLTYSVWKHMKWIKVNNNGQISHTGEGSSTPSVRAQPYTSATASIGENLLMTGVKVHNGEHMVSQYIIDDGVASRGHRTNIYKASYKKIGIGLIEDNSGNYLHGSVFADDFNCDKCNLITCAMQEECGWTKYLADNGMTDPCKANGSGGSSSGGSTSGGSTSANATVPAGLGNFTIFFSNSNSSSGSELLLKMTWLLVASVFLAVC